MVNKKADLINQRFVHIRLSVIWVAIASTQFGFHLAATMWKRRDLFYPFDLLLWGFIGIFWLFRVRGILVGLIFNVPPERAGKAKRSAFSLLAYTLCTGIVSLSFAVGFLAAISFGRLYVIAAVVLATLMGGMILLTIRMAKRLTGWFLQNTNEILV